MTKAQLLKQIADASPDARITMVDANSFVIDIEEVLVSKAREGWLARDEVQLFRARP